MKYLGMIIIFLGIQSQLISAFDNHGQISLIKDYLSEQTKLKINDLPGKLESYLNSAPYSGENINLTYQITLSLKEKSSGTILAFTAEGQFYEENYKIQYRDKKIDLYYDPTEILIFNEYQLHNLTSVFDFYFYIIIGDIMDNYKDLGGNPYYHKSLRIAQESMMKSNYRGWDRRLEKIENVLSDKIKPFRRAKVIVQSALIAAQKDDFEIANTQILGALNAIHSCQQEMPREEVFAEYLSSIHIQVAEAFRNSGMPDIYRTLIMIDTLHSNYYQQFLPKE